MLTRIAPEDVQKIDFVPQAIFNLPLTWFTDSPSAIRREVDDLDEFSVLYFSFNNKTIAVKAYKGFPEGTTSLYMDWSIKDEREITNTVHEFMSELSIPGDRLRWERQQGLPEQLVVP